MTHVRNLASPPRQGHSPDPSHSEAKAFTEGHIETFTAIDGIPTRHICYDHLTSAVAAVLYSTTDRRRTEIQRWILSNRTTVLMRSIASRVSRGFRQVVWHRCSAPICPYRVELSVCGRGL